jgi:hypothetical protein
VLSNTFAINVLAYAVMSNHYHLVPHVDNTRADNSSMENLISCWLKLYRGPEIIRRFVIGNLADEELEVVLETGCPKSPCLIPALENIQNYIKTSGFTLQSVKEEYAAHD